MKPILGALAATLATICAAQAQTVTGAQIMADWTDKTTHATLPDGRAATLQFAKDGKITIKGAVNDTGTWKPTETGYCTKYRELRKGAEACFKVEKAGDKYVVTNTNGSPGGTITAIK